MARSRTSKFDASEVITNELIRVIERGVLLWRKAWTAGVSTRPLRHNGEPYQGINNFLLTMRTQLAGYASPFWMTIRQANALEAKVRKGEKSSVVVYYGQSRSREDEREADDQNEETASTGFRFQKAYRVFNAIDIVTSFTGREAYYMAAVDKVYMPDIALFEDPRSFYGVWAHELAHATKARHRLNRSYGDARFGNTAYAREEIVAELTSCFLGQELGFSAHTLEMSAAYLDSWLRVLRSDKTAISHDLHTLPRMPPWVTSARPETPEDVAFLSGAALSYLHLIFTDESVPQTLLRARMALRAAEVSVTFSGRPEGVGELRDAVGFLQPATVPDRRVRFTSLGTARWSARFPQRCCTEP